MKNLRDLKLTKRNSIISRYATDKFPMKLNPFLFNLDSLRTNKTVTEFPTFLERSNIAASGSKTCFWPDSNTERTNDIDNYILTEIFWSERNIMRSGSGPSRLKTQGQRNKKEQQKYFANTLSVSLYSYLSLSIYICFSLSQSLSLSLSVSLFLSVSLCLSLFLCLSVSLCFSLSLSLTQKFNTCTYHTS